MFDKEKKKRERERERGGYGAGGTQHDQRISVSVEGLVNHHCRVRKKKNKRIKYV